MHKAVEVAFADAIACAGLMEDGLKHGKLIVMINKCCTRGDGRSEGLR